MATTNQKDQLSEKTGIKKTKPQYAAQSTLQYKTFLKRTLVEALQNAFALYEDPSLSEAKISVNYQTERVNFPCIVVKFYEQGLKNAGVGHSEWSNTHELESIKGVGSVHAATGEVTSLAATNIFYAGKTTVKGKGIPKGTFIKEILSPSRILLSQFPTVSEDVTLTFTDVFSTKFIQYHHYIYHGNISLEIYGLSSTDRDKVADAVVEVVAMGEVGPEGATFQARIYETIEAENLPYSSWHFPVVNTDLLDGYGEQQQIANWMPEDVWVYKTEYRFPVMGEFYSITPRSNAGALELVKEVDIYPWDDKDPFDTPPEDFPEGIIPKEDYIPITELPKRGEEVSKTEGEGLVFVFTGETEDDLEAELGLSARLIPVP